MPRTLILMRHARQSTLAASDHERPLTDEGRDTAHRVGEALRRAGCIPDQALSSTALRCRQTWESVSAAFETAQLNLEVYETYERIKDEKKLNSDVEQAMASLRFTGERARAAVTSAAAR